MSAPRIDFMRIFRTGSETGPDPRGAQGPAPQSAPPEVPGRATAVKARLGSLYGELEENLPALTDYLKGEQTEGWGLPDPAQLPPSEYRRQMSAHKARREEWRDLRRNVVRALAVRSMDPTTPADEKALVDKHLATLATSAEEPTSPEERRAKAERMRGSVVSPTFDPFVEAAVRGGASRPVATVASAVGGATGKLLELANRPQRAVAGALAQAVMPEEGEAGTGAQAARVWGALRGGLTGEPSEGILARALHRYPMAAKNVAHAAAGVIGGLPGGPEGVGRLYATPPAPPSGTPERAAMDQAALKAGVVGGSLLEAVATDPLLGFGPTTKWSALTRQVGAALEGVSVPAQAEVVEKLPRVWRMLGGTAHEADGVRGLVRSVVTKHDGPADAERAVKALDQIVGGPSAPHLAEPGIGYGIPFSDTARAELVPRRMLPWADRPATAEARRAYAEFRKRRATSRIEAETNVAPAVEAARPLSPEERHAILVDEMDPQFDTRAIGQVNMARPDLPVKGGGVARPSGAPSLESLRPGKAAMGFGYPATVPGAPGEQRVAADEYMRVTQAVQDAEQARRVRMGMAEEGQIARNPASWGPDPGMWMSREARGVTPRWTPAEGIGGLLSRTQEPTLGRLLGAGQPAFKFHRNPLGADMPYGAMEQYNAGRSLPARLQAAGDAWRQGAGTPFRERLGEVVGALSKPELEAAQDPIDATWKYVLRSTTMRHKEMSRRWLADVYGETYGAGTDIRRLSGATGADQVGIAARQAQRPGYVSMQDSAGRETWVPKRLASEFDRTWGNTVAPTNVGRAVDSFVTWWKKNVTLNVPRYHLVNMSGDSMLALLDHPKNLDTLGSWTHVLYGKDPGRWREVLAVGKDGHPYTAREIYSTLERHGGTGFMGEADIGRASSEKMREVQQRTDVAGLLSPGAETGGKFAEAWSTTSRLAVLTNKLRLGEAPAQAIQSTYRVLFDYGDVPTFWRWMRRAVPFSTWQTKATGFLAKQLVEKPGLTMAPYKLTQPGMESDVRERIGENRTPPEHPNWRQMPTSLEGTPLTKWLNVPPERMLGFASRYPMTEIAQQLPTEASRKGVQRAAEDVVGSMVGPWARVPIEWVMGRRMRADIDPSRAPVTAEYAARELMPSMAKAALPWAVDIARRRGIQVHMDEEGLPSTARETAKLIAALNLFMPGAIRQLPLEGQKMRGPELDRARAVVHELTGLLKQQRALEAPAP